MYYDTTIMISALTRNVGPSGVLQVVAFQATMELMAEQFPGAFAGYRLQVVESHQRSKVDTSGTARAIVQSFQKLGLDFDEVRTSVPGTVVTSTTRHEICCGLTRSAFVQRRTEPNRFWPADAQAELPRSSSGKCCSELH